MLASLVCEDIACELDYQALVEHLIVHYLALLPLFFVSSRLRRF